MLIQLLRNLTNALKVILHHPVGSGVATHIMSNAIDAGSAYLREAMQPHNEQHIREPEVDGHAHLQRSIYHPDSSESRQYLSAAYNSYLAHAKGDTYATFWAHYWCAVVMTYAGQLEDARDHMRAAYRCGGIVIQEPDSLEKGFSEGGVDYRYEVAVVMKTIESLPGVTS